MKRRQPRKDPLNYLDYFGYLEFGLRRKGFAKSKKGKLRITPKGRKRLEHLKDAAKLTRSRIVEAAIPTAVKKKIVFVCPGGMESSLSGLERFKALAKANPANANLVLDYSGWLQSPKQVFRKDVLSADYVVPMGPGVAEKLKSVLGEKAAKEKIIDPKFNTISDQYEMKRYQDVLDKIKKNLEKEKK